MSEAVVGLDPRRHPVLRTLDALVRLKARLGFPPAPIDGPRLVAEARRRTGLDDLGEGPAEEGIRVLADALEHEAGFSPFGRRVARKMVDVAIERRLRIVDLVRRTPEIQEQEIRRPLFIVAPPRTGTTLLYNLLAQDPDARPLLSWEAYHPLPPSRRRGPDPRIAKHVRSIRILDWLAPDLQRIHPVTPEGPEECIPLLLRTFLTNAWSMIANLPSYAAWVRSRPEEEHRAAYRLHRDQLRLLQWQRNGSGTWLLKSPAHSLGLPALLATYPDAVVVRTHRDLTRVLPSTCSLFRASRVFFQGRTDAHELGENVFRMARHVLELVQRPLPPDAARRVVEVRYADLVADPIATVERVQEAAGRSMPDAMRERMRAWLAQNPRHKQGVHKYTLEDFGLDRREVETLAAPYHARFDVPPE